MGSKMTYVSIDVDENTHREYERALTDIVQEFGEHHPMYIGDREVYAEDTFAVTSPIDREILLGVFQRGGKREMEEAIGEAKRSEASWSSVEWQVRMRAIRAAADTLDRQRFPLSALLTYEVGKTRTEALAEIGEAVDLLRYYADTYEENDGYVLPMTVDPDGEQSWSLMRPYGVFAVISPFNFPIALAGGMCAAALLTGNTVVFKPTSVAPFSGLKVYRAFVDGGVPAGAINLVTGPGGPFGNVVAAHPDVDGIAFTGSKAVGMWLYRERAVRQPYPKPLIAEMGSKNPTIVTGEADLGKAVEGVVRAAFGYGGQKCSATSRLYVQDSVADEFARRLVRRVEEVKVGDPRDRDVFYGPVIDERAKRTYEDAVRQAEEDGGSILTGGKALTGGLFSRGHYLTPAVVTDLPEGHRLTRDELFVPFLILKKFTRLDEALREANDTDFGLTAGIFSEEESELKSFFEHIRFGTCYANRRGGATTGAWPGIQPFSGWKGSGSTGKGVGGAYYLLSFLREQTQTRVG
ncbi:MAG: aldehyde dehydrogenase family protein [Methanomicrobiales archaeon]|nr:aldehyde dehydrogenase family protein [Methanomicrobiales archaeon]MDI6876383.1 aldehyde dehydrogenase family protein [Methanomicrobiales archaeon]